MFNKNVKLMCLSFFVFILSSCANPPIPNYIGGKYFMAGDPDCAYARISSDNDAQCICFNKKGEFTGHRNEISEMQAKAWYNKNQAQSTSKIQKPIICNTFGTMTTCW